MSTDPTAVPPILSWSSFISEEAAPFQTSATLSKALAALSATAQQPLDSAAFAREVDRLDPLAIFRDQFHVPKAKDIAEAILHGSTQSEAEHSVTATLAPTQESVYLCGNSLGLLPRQAQTYVTEELTKWGALGVEGHFAGARPWARVDEPPTELSIPVVGARIESEIAIMNSLSVNLHLLLTSFYRPTSTRYKILMEADAFCSDHHVIQSQVALHGRTPEEGIITLSPRDGESTLRTEDIVRAIEADASCLALVLLPGIQFYTGQLFDMAAITAAGHAAGAYVGWDLAHAVGNVPLKLHEWQVDFAAWCSYKYLNAGPGSIAGIFVHEAHHHTDQLTGVGGTAPTDATNVTVSPAVASMRAAAAGGAQRQLVKLRGWWGQTPSQRFAMKSVHVEKPGAQSYMLSNPAVLPTVCLQASLELHNRAGQHRMRAKSLLLTGYLEQLLKAEVGARGDLEWLEAGLATPSPVDPESASVAPLTIRILTPSLPSARGCQLSLLFNGPARPIHRALSLHGIVTDVREPNVIRVSPTPLYNTFADVFAFVHQLKVVLRQINEQRAANKA